MLEDMPEQGAADSHSPREAHVGSVQCRHERPMRHSREPAADYPAGKPPMGMNDVRLEASPRANRRNEIRAKEPNESEPCAPRGCDVLRHGPGVGELLVAPRRIAKALDCDSLERFRR